MIPIASGLSLLLSVATAGLWIRSYGIRDTVSYGCNGGGIYVTTKSDAGIAPSQRTFIGQSDFGILQLRIEHAMPFLAEERTISEDLEFPIGWKHQVQHVNESVMRYSRTGAGFDVRPREEFSERAYVLWFPHWCLCVITVFPPVLLLRWRWQRRVRAGNGQCLVCAYDLRASKERCPECGTPIG